MNTNSKNTGKLGLFVICGILLFMVAVYLIGQNKNLFAETFDVKSTFKNVSGLTPGNNVRFGGINVGTVKSIEFVSDSSVVVTAVVKEEVHKYIKSDAKASIGSDGLMGTRIVRRGFRTHDRIDPFLRSLAWRVPIQILGVQPDELVAAPQRALQRRAHDHRIHWLAGEAEIVEAKGNADLQRPHRTQTA